MSRTIRIGSRGAEVQTLQRLLDLPVTGNFDRATDTALRLWQGRNMLDADGIAGPMTWKKLMEVATPTASASDGVVIRSGVPPEVPELSEAFEGIRLAPYLDSAGVWTIGIGSTRDLNGNQVTRDTPPITHEQAAQMASRDLAKAAALLAVDFPDGLPARWWAVGVLLNNNLGRMSVWGPTLLRLLRAKDWRGAAEQLKAYRNADGKPSTGLRRRRWAEAAYALGMDAKAARAKAWASIHNPDDWPPLPA